MQSHTINQLVKINVYNTEADMPHGFALFWQNFVKYLPTIGLVIIGLVALALIAYIIFKYHKGKRFWRQFGIAMMLITLFGWGYYGVNQYSLPLTLESDTLQISIIKDTGEMTASTNSKIKLKVTSQGGHNTYAKTSTPTSTVGFLSAQAYAEPAEDQIKLYVNDIELTGDEVFVDSSRNQLDEYTVLAVVDSGIVAGEYTEELEWRVGDRDWMMSASNSLSKSDLGNPSKLATDQQFVSEVALEKGDSGWEMTTTSGSLHYWLNAPDPIRRENIKSIKFGDGTFQYSNYSNDANVQREIEDCKTVDKLGPEGEPDGVKDNEAALNINPDYCKETVVAKYNGHKNKRPSGDVEDLGINYDNLDSDVPKIRSTYDGCWDISEHQSGTVVACYVERIRTEDYPGVFSLSDAWDAAGAFVDWLNPFSKSAEEKCTENNPLIPNEPETTSGSTNVNKKYDSSTGKYFIDKNGDGVWNTGVDNDGDGWIDSSQTAQTDCATAAKAPLYLGIYDIVIKQQDGVSAPKDSTGLFYYTGQNTMYCMYGPKTVVNPTMGNGGHQVLDRATEEKNGFFIVNLVDAYAQWREVLTKLVAMNDPNYSPGGFHLLADFLLPDWLYESPEDKMQQYLEGCHEDFIDTPTTISLKNFKTDGVENMSHMFEGANFSDINQKIVDTKDTEWFTTNNTKDMSYMFATITVPSVGKSQAGEFDITKTGINLDKVENISGMFSGSRFKKIILSSESESITNMSYLFSAAAGEVAAEQYNGYSPDWTQKSGDIDIMGLKTISATTMSHMFEGANAKIRASSASFLTDNVTDMSYMFAGAEATSSTLSLKHFVTANVENMSAMFLNTKFGSIDLSSFDTKNVKNMSSMFEACDTGNLSLAAFDTSQVANMANMFFNTTATTIDFGDHFKTQEVTNMNGIFANTVFTAKNTSSIKLNTAKVTDMGSMFFNAEGAVKAFDLTKFDTSKVKDMSYMFANFKISSKPKADVGTGSTTPEDSDDDGTVKSSGEDDGRKSNRLYVTDQKHKDEKTTEYLDNPMLKVTGVSKWTEAFITIMELKDRELTNWRDADPKNYGKNYNTTNDLNLTSFNTSNVENMEGMFLGAQYPTIKLDDTKFKTGKVKNMAYMFAMLNASELNTKVAKFDTSKVETMEGMFAGTILKSPDSLDLSSFTDTSLKNTRFMFAYSNIYGDIGKIKGIFDPCKAGKDSCKYIFEHYGTITLSSGNGGGSSNNPNTGNGQLGWPLASARTISSPYGMRLNPATGQYALHQGIDLPVPSGTPVYAADAGTVQFTGNICGNAVVIDHTGGLRTRYLHLERFLVDTGDKVTKGQQIALSDNSGGTSCTTGPHLHFEVWLNGASVNPASYLGK